MIKYSFNEFRDIFFQSDTIIGIPISKYAIRMLIESDIARNKYTKFADISDWVYAKLVTSELPYKMYNSLINMTIQDHYDFWNWLCIEIKKEG